MTFRVNVLCSARAYRDGLKAQNYKVMEPAGPAIGERKNIDIKDFHHKQVFDVDHQTSPKHRGHLNGLFRRGRVEAISLPSMQTTWSRICWPRDGSGMDSMRS